MSTQVIQFKPDYTECCVVCKSKTDFYFGIDITYEDKSCQPSVIAICYDCMREQTAILESLEKDYVDKE